MAPETYLAVVGTYGPADREGIHTIEVDPETGTLTETDAGPTGAVDPCHCSVDATGRYLFAVHYGDGVVSMLPTGDDGAVGNPVAVLEHEGASVDPDRQNAPHPHSATPGPENRFLYVPDLGTTRSSSTRWTSTTAASPGGGRWTSCRGPALATSRSTPPASGST